MDDEIKLGDIKIRFAPDLEPNHYGASNQSSSVITVCVAMSTILSLFTYSFHQ